MGTVKKNKFYNKTKYGSIFLKNSEIKTFNKITKEIIIESFKDNNFNKEFSKLENILGINSLIKENDTKLIYNLNLKDITNLNTLKAQILKIYYYIENDNGVFLEQYKILFKEKIKNQDKNFKYAYLKRYVEFLENISLNDIINMLSVEDDSDLFLLKKLNNGDKQIIYSNLDNLKKYEIKILENMLQKLLYCLLEQKLLNANFSNEICKFEIKNIEEFSITNFNKNTKNISLFNILYYIMNLRSHPSAASVSSYYISIFTYLLQYLKCINSNKLMLLNELNQEMGEIYYEENYIEGKNYIVFDFHNSIDFISHEKDTILMKNRMLLE